MSLFPGLQGINLQALYGQMKGSSDQQQASNTASHRQAMQQMLASALAKQAKEEEIASREKLAQQQMMAESIGRIGDSFKEASKNKLAKDEREKDRTLTRTENELDRDIKRTELTKADERFKEEQKALDRRQKTSIDAIAEQRELDRIFKKEEEFPMKAKSLSLQESMLQERLNQQDKDNKRADTSLGIQSSEASARARARHQEQIDRGDIPKDTPFVDPYGSEREPMSLGPPSVFMNPSTPGRSFQDSDNLVATLRERANNPELSENARTQAAITADQLESNAESLKKSRKTPEQMADEERTKALSDIDERLFADPEEALKTNPIGLISAWNRMNPENKKMHPELGAYADKAGTSLNNTYKESLKEIKEGTSKDFTTLAKSGSQEVKNARIYLGEKEAYKRENEVTTALVNKLDRVIYPDEFDDFMINLEAVNKMKKEVGSGLMIPKLVLRMRPDGKSVLTFDQKGYWKVGTPEEYEKAMQEYKRLSEMVGEPSSPKFIPTPSGMMRTM